MDNNIRLSWPMMIIMLLNSVSEMSPQLTGKPIRVGNFRSQYSHEYEGVRSSVEEPLALAFHFARISIALLIRLSSQLADLTIHLFIVLLHCVATITPIYILLRLY